MVEPIRKAVRTVALDAIRLDGDTQRRERIDPDTVAEYAARIEADDPFPPVEVVEDCADYLWLWDGFQRYQAHVRAGRNAIQCRVTKGTLEDARWLSFSANKANGVRLTREEKREVIRLALLAKPLMSNRAIADHVGVSDHVVADVRSELSAHYAQIATREVTRGGTTYAQDTSRIGKPDPNADESIPWDDDPQADAPLYTEAPIEPDEGDTSPWSDEGPPDEEGTPHVADVPRPRVPKPEPVPADENGLPIPEKARAAFALVPEFRKLCKLIDDASDEALRLGKSAAGAQLHPQSVQSHLANAKNGVWMRRPYAVCPYCRGEKKICDACKAHGWVTKSTYNAAPPELRGDDV